MSNTLSIGSIAYRQSGIGGTVLKIETDKVFIEYPDGIKRLPLSAIVRWESPQSIDIKVGEIVRYTGIDRRYLGSFGKLLSIEAGICSCDFGGMIVKRLPESDLAAMETSQPTTPPVSPTYRKGDSVRFIGDRESGRRLNLDQGEILTVTADCEAEGEWVNTRTAGMKPKQIPVIELEPVNILQ